MTATTTKIEQWQKDMIQRQFQLCYGMKQLIQDGKEEAIRILAHRTGFSFMFLKSNLKELKEI